MGRITEDQRGKAVDREGGIRAPIQFCLAGEESQTRRKEQREIEALGLCISEMTGALCRRIKTAGCRNG